MICADLRNANMVRQAEWGGGVPLSLAYKGNELFGEAGEAANVIKKLERERLGIRGSRASVQDLADELADVVICVDLIGLEAGCEPVRFAPPGVTTASLDLGVLGNGLGANVGRVCHILAAPGALGFQEGLHAALEDVVYAVHCIASLYGIDLNRAVADKFNATSQKVGLETRLAA